MSYKVYVIEEEETDMTQACPLKIMQVNSLSLAWNSEQARTVLERKKLHQKH